MDLAGVDRAAAARLGVALSHLGWRAHGPVHGSVVGYPWRLLVRKPWGVTGDPLDRLAPVLRQAAHETGLRLARIDTAPTDTRPADTPPADQPADTPADTRGGDALADGDVPAGAPEPEGGAVEVKEEPAVPRDGAPAAPASDTPDRSSPAADWYSAAAAELRRLRDTVHEPETLQRLAELDRQFQALRDLHNAAYGLALLDHGHHSLAFDHLSTIPKSRDLLGSRLLEAVHFLADRSIKLQEYQQALDVLDHVGTHGTEETEALRGLARYGLNDARSARRSLARALEKGYLGRDAVWTYAELCRADGHPYEAGRYLQAYHEAHPGDVEVTRVLLDIYEDQPELRARFADRFVLALEREDEIKEAADIFRIRAEALAAVGAPQHESALADAVEALLLARREEEALTLVLDHERDRGRDPDLHLDLLSLLEAARSPEVRDDVADAYMKVGLDEIERMPKHDPDLLQDVAQRLFVLDRGRYDELKEHYEAELQDLVAQPEALVGSVPERLTDPEPVSLGGLSVLVVGGSPAVRRRVRETLRSQYKVGSVADVPSKWEANRSQKNLRDKVRRADIIVLVTSCLAHSTQETIEAAQGAGDIGPRAVYPAGRGHTSILRAILDHVRQQRAGKEKVG